MHLFVQQPQIVEASWQEVYSAALRLYARLITFIPEFFGALIVIVFTLLMVRLVRRTLLPVLGRTTLNGNVQFLLLRSLSIAIWLLGLSVVLSVLNINMTGTFTALGVTGAAIGFAVHDVIGNFVAGLVLLSSQPFKLGDTVQIDAYEGTVKRIEVRATVIQVIDGREVSIPNSKVFGGIIIKQTDLSSRRITLSLQVSDIHPFALVKETLLAAVQKTPGVAADPAPEIYVNAMNFNSLTVELRCWVADAKAQVTTASNLRVAVKVALQNAEITLIAPPNNANPAAMAKIV
jgi:small conductance mechanosensitive channel